MMLYFRIEKQVSANNKIRSQNSIKDNDHHFIWRQFVDCKTAMIFDIMMRWSFISLKIKWWRYNERKHEIWNEYGMSQFVRNEIFSINHRWIYCCLFSIKHDIDLDHHHYYRLSLDEKIVIVDLGNYYPQHKAGVSWIWFPIHFWSFLYNICEFIFIICVWFVSIWHY